MTEATPTTESQRATFRWWGERDRIVIVGRPARSAKRTAEPASSAAGQVCEAAA